MKRVVLISFALALLMAFAPGAALGKGASEASITGPGLSNPISLAGEGQPGGEQLMHIAEHAGFFPAVFVQSPDPMLDERPSGALGPKYTITYVMPGPNGEEDTVIQGLYPYAEPAPVTYVEAGQRFWTTEQTRGGWFIATPLLQSMLVDAGLPRNAPVADDRSEFPWRAASALMAALVLLALGGLAVLVIRRGPQTA